MENTEVNIHAVPMFTLLKTTPHHSNEDPLVLVSSLTSGPQETILTVLIHTLSHLITHAEPRLADIKTQLLGHMHTQTDTLV